jgi:hypothetical protein
MNNMNQEGGQRNARVIFSSPLLHQMMESRKPFIAVFFKAEKEFFSGKKGERQSVASPLSLSGKLS